MKTYFDCIPCFVRQGLDSVRLVTDDERVHEQVMREIIKLTSMMDLYQSPPAMAKKIHQIIRQLTKIDDPYRETKKGFNEFALKLYPGLQKQIIQSEKSFEAAVRLAIAGNVIDLGVKSLLEISEVEKSIENAMIAPFDLTNLDDFKSEAIQANDILYLGDNAGEVVFDRFLIEQIGPEKITFAVRGKPVINDATMEDAFAAGLTDLVKVIDNGDDTPGTILETCSQHFRDRFEKADLIIAKGQGNYETLSDVDKNIFFLVKAKCPVIARDLGCKVGEMILQKSNSFKRVDNLIREAE